jgi:uncharacterized protein GlcG (DUF336 family)
MLKNRFVLVVATSAVLLAASSSALLGQEIITQKALSLDAAQAVAQGALEKCRADGYRVTVTVIDGGGTTKAFLHDDGAGLHTIGVSREKAYTALTFKRTSAETGKAWAANPPAPNIEGTVGRAGGVPIKAGDEVIGAIGVSGSPGGEKDEVCAFAGVAKIASQLKGMK